MENKRMSNNNLSKEAEHFDQMVAGKSSEIYFYDSPFVKIVMDDLNATAFHYLGPMNGKKILFYGCGANFSPIQKMIAKKCRKVCAVDISPKSIDRIEMSAAKAGFSKNVSPEVMDCMSLRYNDHTFDLVYGRAILHHLDLDRALHEIHRVLKPGGRAVFLEPLGSNPIINLFRSLTPSRRTEDEHPFTKADFSKINHSEFLNIDYHYYNLSVNLGIFTATIFKIVQLDKRHYRFLKKMDSLLLEYLPFLRQFCWNTIITLKKD